MSYRVKSISKGTLFTIVIAFIFIVTTITVAIKAMHENSNLRNQYILLQKQNRKLEKQSKVLEQKNKQINAKLNTCLSNRNKLLLTTQVKKKLVNWIVTNHTRAYPELANNVVTYAYQYSQYPLVILALVSVESSYDFQTISSAGAYGGTQVRCSDWKDKLIKQGIIKNTCKELFNPRKSILAGNFILNTYISKCGTLQGGLSAYLTGSCNSKLSNHYVMKVYKRLGELYLISNTN